MHVSIIGHGYDLTRLINICFIGIKGQASNFSIKKIIPDKLRLLWNFITQLKGRKLFFHI